MKNETLHKLLVLLLIVLFVGCEYESKYTKRYIVSKSDSNGLNLSGNIECDSVTMTSRNKAILWIDGHKLTIEGELISIYSNKNYIKHK